MTITTEEIEKIREFAHSPIFVDEGLWWKDCLTLLTYITEQDTMISSLHTVKDELGRRLGEEEQKVNERTTERNLAQEAVDNLQQKVKYLEEDLKEAESAVDALMNAGQKEDELRIRVKELGEKYNELIMAVERKWPNESRHETALKYIKGCESSASNIGKWRSLKEKKDE
jgi:seryl-tRNA synthetase